MHDLLSHNVTHILFNDIKYVFNSFEKSLLILYSACSRMPCTIGKGVGLLNNDECIQSKVGMQFVEISGNR